MDSRTQNAIQTIVDSGLAGDAEMAAAEIRLRKARATGDRDTIREAHADHTVIFATLPRDDGRLARVSAFLRDADLGSDCASRSRSPVFKTSKSKVTTAPTKKTLRTGQRRLDTRRIDDDEEELDYGEDGLAPTTLAATSSDEPGLHEAATRLSVNDTDIFPPTMPTGSTANRSHRAGTHAERSNESGETSRRGRSRRYKDGPFSQTLQAPRPTTSGPPIDHAAVAESQARVQRQQADLRVLRAQTQQSATLSQQQQQQRMQRAWQLRAQALSVVNHNRQPRASTGSTSMTPGLTTISMPPHASNGPTVMTPTPIANDVNAAQSVQVQTSEATQYRGLLEAIAWEDAQDQANAQVEVAQIKHVAVQFDQVMTAQNQLTEALVRQSREDRLNRQRVRQAERQLLLAVQAHDQLISDIAIPFNPPTGLGPQQAAQPQAHGNEYGTASNPIQINEGRHQFGRPAMQQQQLRPGFQYVRIPSLAEQQQMWIDTAPQHPTMTPSMTEHRQQHMPLPPQNQLRPIVGQQQHQQNPAHPQYQFRPSAPEQQEPLRQALEDQYANPPRRP